MDIVATEPERHREEDMDAHYVEEIQSYLDADFLLENGLLVLLSCREECYQ